MTFTKVSVLIPTRRRVERLRKMLESYEHTVEGCEEFSEIVLRVDEDDHATREFLRGFSRPYFRQIIVGPRGQGYASMSSFYNEMSQAACGDVLMVGNDDMVFRTIGWAPKILEAANKFPDGIFDFGVSTYNEDHYPFSIISRAAADQMGFFWDPRIYWGDIFLRDVMGAFGRCMKLPEVDVEHDWMGHAPDETFVEADQPSIFRNDPTYWAGTHATAVAEAVQRLRVKPIHVCVPVLKRYDLLRELVFSVLEGSVHATMLHIIDNGRQPELSRPVMALAVEAGLRTEVFLPKEPLGIAESWNWFIKHVPEERFIVNDDIKLGKDSLERLVGTPGDFVSGLAGSNACSCFVLRDSCVEKVGLFDESISPGYAYFEDCDYVERMVQQKVRITAVECGIVHGGSQTVAVNTPAEWNAHHEKFQIAQNNFMKKWGRMPDVNRAGLYD